ncbi:MAG: hypothetical protein RUMPE_00789 [Eubacteriales bacterium SKADARSKE-1]|nr:hypothetical protein [Eubacteriales bacterium SKADARSKE-1]
MKLYIKDSKDINFSRFLIFDELGNIRYRVSIEYTSLAAKLDVYDTNNKRIAKIRKRDIMSFTTYTVSCKKGKIKVIGKLTGEDPGFYINGINWYLNGCAPWHNFDIINVDKSIVMTHCMKWSQFGSNYELKINEEDKELLCVCISLCIDTLLVNLEKTKAVAPLRNQEAARTSY